MSKTFDLSHDFDDSVRANNKAIPAKESKRGKTKKTPRKKYQRWEHPVLHTEGKPKQRFVDNDPVIKFECRTYRIK